MDDLISRLSEIRSEYNCFDENEEPYYRALSEAIKILSRREDRDTISRQAAIDALRDMYHAAEKWAKEASDDVIKARAESCMASLIEMKLRIEKLPSAGPERESAEWVCWYEEIKNDTCTEYIPHCKCPECGTEYDPHTVKFINFCSYCGAKMGGKS